MSIESELESLSFPEAPKIIVKPPGPKSLELLRAQEELETRALVYPKAFRFAIDSARGATIRDVDGNYYIDWVAGIAVMNVGHNNPYVAQAIKEQLDRYWHWMSEVPSEVRIRFLRNLHSILPEGLRGRAKVMTTVTGADACEAAIALARWVTRKPVVMAFEGAYHGVHQGIVMATAKTELQHFAGVPLVNVVRVPYPYPYRCPLPAKDPEDCGNAVLNYIEHLLSDPYTGIGEVGAIIVEPIQGEGGYIVPPRNFLRGLREIADRHGILLIADEVQTGVGRTGRWWAVEHFGVTPDIMCVSKAIGGGIPTSFIVYRSEYDEKVPEMFHFGTYRANPLALAAGSAVIEYIQSRNLLERTRQLGEYALRAFEDIAERYQVIGDVRGLGFMIGIELVKDARTKEPGAELAVQVRKELFERGVLMHTCGHYGNVMRFMAPLVLTRRHLDEGIRVFEEVIRGLSTHK
ncbi:aspartate aminotransferase family protein [Vulcanisaeta thermophila]|uniref:aspartate aminotransferase family protein n=1 Tax=Vulcanisaeta thermophila TaxID=867917 RepID=UPI000A009B78|nr:aspartate aminotransferase family protein [Vulcanisaeta thermophila]